MTKGIFFWSKKIKKFFLIQQNNTKKVILIPLNDKNAYSFYPKKKKVQEAPSRATKWQKVKEGEFWDFVRFDMIPFPLLFVNVTLHFNSYL